MENISFNKSISEINFYLYIINIYIYNNINMFISISSFQAKYTRQSITVTNKAIRQRPQKTIKYEETLRILPT